MRASGGGGASNSHGVFEPDLASEWRLRLCAPVVFREAFNVVCEASVLDSSRGSKYDPSQSLVNP